MLLLSLLALAEGVTHVPQEAAALRWYTAPVHVVGHLPLRDLGYADLVRFRGVDGGHEGAGAHVEQERDHRDKEQAGPEDGTPYQ